MSASVISPERRIELNPFDVDAWNLLLRESQTRSIDQARPFYEKLVTQFPNAGRYWKAYIEHELFARCLIKVLNIDLWKCYVFYVRETKGHLASFREKMAQAYDFALDRVGLDMHSYSIYADYVSFLKTVPAVGQYAENQRISAVRKVYQRGIVTPMINIEQLWAEYCAFEKSVNATLAERLISERNKDYQSAKKVSRLQENVTRGINRQAVSVPSRGSAVELKQIDLWKKYVQWEKTNPTQTDDYAHFAKRVIYAYEQALLCLGYHPDIWYETSLFQQETARTLTEKGEVKLANLFVDEIAALFERAIGALMRDSQLLYFAYADFEEERMKYEKAFIQLMKFTRRTEGVAAARVVFARARKDERARFHVYVAAALMEYFCSKGYGITMERIKRGLQDSTVAMKIFDLGLKKFGDEPEYALAYVDFLAHLNQDNNTRVIFERILTSGTLPVEKSLEIWDRYLEFESQVGDLASILKVDKRRREALREQFGEMQTLLLIDRYKCLNLVPCTAEQLRTMGYVPRALPRSGSLVGGAGVGTSSSGGGTVSLSGLPGTLPNGASIAGNAPTTSSGQRPLAPTGPSVVMGGGGFEMGGYPRPDTEQMIPFKPKVQAAGSYHPVPGGVFPPPPAAAALMQMLPPPWTFRGPFVSVDLLMDYIAKYQMSAPPTVNQVEKPEAGTMFGTQRLEDVKKEFYQLLATTPDPATLMASSEYQAVQQQQQNAAAAARKRRAAGDSDSDDEGRSNVGGGAAFMPTATRDIYRMRMNKKAA